MTVSLERVQEVTRQTGFNVATVEKVIHLMNFLEAIEGHPFLREKFALKGGTALNLFVFPPAAPLRGYRSQSCPTALSRRTGSKPI